MYYANFHSPDPLDHIVRTLDILRCMNFNLQSISAEECDFGVSRVEVIYMVQGRLSSDTFVDRVRKIFGIENFDHGLIDD